MVKSLVKFVPGFIPGRLAPSMMVAVTTTSPGPVTESTLPPVSSAPGAVVPVAFTLQTMSLFVASTGTTVPTSSSGVPTLCRSGMPVISVTGTKLIAVMVKFWV